MLFEYKLKVNNIMNLRFLSPKVDSSVELEKSKCIFNIKQMAPKAREVTPLDLGDDVDNTFTVLENLSRNTSFKEYQNAATKFLTGDFLYGSTLFIPKLTADSRRALIPAAVITDIAVSGTYYFMTHDILRTLFTFGVAVPLVLCIGYCFFQNQITLAYATKETWQPKTDLKNQLEYFNSHFVEPNNSDIDKLTLGDLVYLPNIENRMAPSM